MNNSNVHFFYLACIFLFLNSSSCVKDKQQIFPYIYVSFTINPFTDPTFTSLQAQGNAQTVSRYDIGYATLGYGNNGIIVYNAGGGVIYAFDATCPNDLPETKGVIPTTTLGVFECPKCHSRYVLSSDGMPTTAGPAVYPLHTYNAYYNPNTRDINVRN
jgi:nitrite reductase/ring-hydroxylating ferredoxin subunit